MNQQQKRNTRQAQPGAVTRADVRKAVKAAPNEVHVDKITRTSLKTQSNLKGAFVVCVIAPDEVQEQFTIHHPIGITDCKDDDWIMTRSSELHYLTARSEDPKQQQVNTARNERKNLHLVNKKLLEERDGKYYYPQDSSKTRNEYLSEAELHMKANKQPKDAKQPNKVDYLGETQKKAELAIITELKKPEAQAFITSGTGHQSFRTRGGVLEDQEQIPIKGLAGKTPIQAFDVAVRMVFKTIGQGEGVTVEQVQREAKVDDFDEYHRIVNELETAQIGLVTADELIKGCKALITELAEAVKDINPTLSDKANKVVSNLNKALEGDEAL